MAKVDGSNTLKIEVIYSPSARRVQSWTIELPAGSLVQAALAATAFSEFPELQSDRLMVGIWGKKKGLNHGLKSGDRVEIYRALRIDPKVARRERFQRQGAKTAGLFAKTRAGGKAGY